MQLHRHSQSHLCVYLYSLATNLPVHFQLLLQGEGKGEGGGGQGFIAITVSRTLKLNKFPSTFMRKPYNSLERTHTAVYNESFHTTVIGRARARAQTVCAH